MNVLRGKNLQKGEVVLFTPELHLIFVLKPVLLLLADAVLFLIKVITANYFYPFGFWTIFGTIYTTILILLSIFSVLYLFWQVIEYFLVQYVITNKRLILKKGLFTSSLIDMPIEKVESIICVQSLFGRLFNYGTIFVSGVGGMFPRYRTIRKPHKVRKIIYDVIDKNKNITIIRENLPKPIVVKEIQREPEIQYGVFVTSYPAGEREDSIE